MADNIVDEGRSYRVFKIKWHDRLYCLFKTIFHLLLGWLPFFKGCRAAFDSGPVRYKTIPEEYETWCTQLSVNINVLIKNYMVVSYGKIYFIDDLEEN